MASDVLSLWMNGKRLGLWRRPASGEEELIYDSDWLASDFARPLSLSLPCPFDGSPIRSRAVANYFENLLPENERLRKFLAHRFNVSASDTFALLGAIGRDCIGAIQILKENEAPEDVGHIDGVELTEHDVAERLRNAAQPDQFNINFRQEDFRISLAGFQAKTALLRLNGKWMLPTGSTPTTHILKLPMGRIGPRQIDFSTSVENEWLCLKLLNALGLESAQATIENFENERVLVVERFDRQWTSDHSKLLRLPQEDFCQVFGLPSSMKYESDGGPGALDIFRILNGSLVSKKDKESFLLTLVVFWLLRAPDGHAKNFSIALLPRNQFKLTKLYDVVSTWPAVGVGPHQLSLKQLRFAMALEGKRRHNRMDRIEVRHFVETARAAGLRPERTLEIIGEMLGRVPEALELVSDSIPEDFSHRVRDKIFEGVLKSTKELSSQLE